jgi:hypothetical protein
MSFLKSSYEAYKLVETLDRETQDREVSMARSNAAAILDKSIMLRDMLTNEPNKVEGLKPWIESKINTAKDNVVAIHDYLKYYPTIKAKYKEVKEEVSKEEVDMIIASLNNIIHKSNEIGEMMVYMKDHNTELEPWVSSKIQTAKDNISAVCDYFHYSPDVAMESYELKEASLTAIHKMQKDGKSVEDIAKELKLNVGLVKKILGEAMTAADRLTAKQRQKMRNIKPEADNVSGGIEGIPAGGHTATGLGLGEDTAADKLNAKQKEKLKNQEIQNNKVAAGIEDVRKNTDTAEIGSITKEAYNILKGGRKVVDTVNMEEKDDFKPHYMYEPKTGEKEWVTTYEKHLELDKKGWGHEAPKKEQVKEVKNCGCGKDPCITYGSQGKDPTIEEHIVKVKGGYELKSKSTGKNLGTYATKAGAEKRERQVQYFKHANESVQETKESTGDLKDACWTGYTAVGFKMKNGKRVPNCVPKSEAYKGAKKIVENAWKKLKGKK